MQAYNQILDALFDKFKADASMNVDMQALGGLRLENTDRIKQITSKIDSLYDVC